MGKTKNMTQIGSLLAVATVLIGLWTLDFTVREGGLYVRQTTYEGT